MDFLGLSWLYPVSCLRQGLAAGLTVDADGEVAGRVAIPDRIDATVELDALAHDYRAWLTAAGRDRRRVQRRRGASELLRVLQGGGRPTPLGRAITDPGGLPRRCTC